MHIFVDGASEIGQIDVDLGVNWEHLFLESGFNIPALAVASLNNLADTSIKRRIYFVLLQSLLRIDQCSAKLGGLFLQRVNPLLHLYYF